MYHVTLVILFCIKHQTYVHVILSHSLLEFCMHSLPTYSLLFKKGWNSAMRKGGYAITEFIVPIHHECNLRKASSLPSVLINREEASTLCSWRDTVSKILYLRFQIFSLAILCKHVVIGLYDSFFSDVKIKVVFKSQFYCNCFFWKISTGLIIRRFESIFERMLFILKIILYASRSFMIS